MPIDIKIEARTEIKKERFCPGTKMNTTQKPRLEVKKFNMRTACPNGKIGVMMATQVVSLTLYFPASKTDLK